MSDKIMICGKKDICGMSKDCWHGKNHRVNEKDLWNCLNGECVQVEGKCKCNIVKTIKGGK